MSWTLPGENAALLEPPPEEAVAPEQQAAPPPAPPPEQPAATNYTLPGENAAPVPQTVPSPGLGGVAEYEPTSGPFEGAVRGAGEALGGAVAPVMEQAPEPVQNLANIVGQPVGGLAGAATDVTGALGQGDIPGAAMAALQPAIEPWRRGIEVVGERVIQGQSPVASPEEMRQDPTQILSILPGLASTYGPAPAISGTPLDVWVEQNPDAAQTAYAQGGGEGVREAWLTATGASDVPPPQLSNPLDAATSASPLERAGQVIGALPELAGGWLQSGKQGTLGPFLLGQAQALAEDPLILIPPAAGERVLGGVARGTGRAARRVPGVGGLIDRATALTPEEAARQVQEQRTTAFGELATARRQQVADPLTADVPPPPPAAAAAPFGDVPPPGPPNPAAWTTTDADYQVGGPRTFQGPGTAVPEPPFSSDYAGRPWQERPVAYTPEGRIFREDLLTNRPRNVPPPDPPPARAPVRNMTDSEIARGTTPTPQPTSPPSREAIGLSGSRWVDNQGHTLVEHPGTPQARIRPRERPRVEAVYRRMFDAEPAQFYAPYQARFFDRNVPVSDQGLLARYRGAMTQGLFMLDDWPAERVARQLPAVATGRTIDWAAVERISATGNEGARTTARKALAGKRAHDLSVHRIANAPDPDLEVRRALLTYHLDQVSGRFDAPQYTNTTYWRDRAAALGGALRDAGYRPSAEAIAALRAMNLADEARAAFPDVPAGRLSAFEGESPFLSGRLGNDLAVRTPQGETIPVISVIDQGGAAVPPAAAAGVVDDVPPSVAPEHLAPEVTPPPVPDQMVTPEELAARQTVRAAYGNAPPEVQRAVDGQTALSRYGVAVSEQAAKDLATPAEGLFRFADGWEPKAGLTAEDVGIQTLLDVDMWVDPASLTTWKGGKRGGAAEGRMTTAWKTLDKRFNPEGDLDAADFAGTDRQGVRDALAVRILDEAQDRARPSGKPKTTLGRINQQYLSTLRTLMLFNYGNVGRYFLQNLAGNSINMTTRGGGARVALDMFAHPSRMRQVFRNQKSGYTTLHGAIELKEGLGHKPNIPMVHKDYIERLGGKPPKGLDILTRIFAPETLRFVGSTADQLGRENVAVHAKWRGYHRLNQELPGMVMEELRRRTIGVPDAKVRRVVRDFLDQNRTLIDPNTGKPYRGFLGRTAKYEPVWEGHELRNYLREHLAEDMIRKPDSQMLDNAVDRVFRTTQTRRRAIADAAEALVDHALFSWRNTNADQMASRVFLFHYWMSHQGGLYVSEALKRPALLSAYGRMMDEFAQQAAALDQPNWMRGFFQMQNSVAGFTVWYSPLDLAQSLLTFADWQYGDDPADAVYKDLTALGKGASQIPFFIHPLLQYVGYVTGALGPDYYTPSLTGVETFGAKAIDLLNLANANGQLPEWVNAAGIGVDEQGNKVPVPHRPLQELYARVGNAISTALEPITGLTPVEVANLSGGSQERNIAGVGEQETRLAHPEWDQMRVNRYVTETLADPGSDDYQAWFRKASDIPFMGLANLPGPVQGALRLLSPVQTYAWPEQVKLDSWEGLQPSGYLPERNLPEDPDAAKAILSESKYGVNSTVEGRRLVEMNNEFKQLVPQALYDARYHASKAYLLGVTEPIEVAGASYAPEDLAGLSSGDLYDLGTQILADAGYTREDVDASYDAQARYLADHPDLAAYKTYQDTVNAHPGGPAGFVQETAAVNPGFAQFVRSSMMNHATGEIDYDAARYPDAYLASQGVRPSVYSPLVGNEPSATPGGYPALGGIPQGQPLLPEVSGAQDIAVYADPGDAKGGYYAQPAIATMQAGAPMQVIDATPRDGMVQVSLGSVGGQPMIGYVDAALLHSNAPAQSTSPAAANPVQPSGGLAGLAGQAAGALGGAVQALGEAVQSLVPTKGPTTPEAEFAPVGSKPGASVTSDATGQQIADLADDFAGVPYVHEFPTAQDDPWQTGWDCSSFVKWLADTQGISDTQLPNQPGYIGGGVPTGSHFQWTWANANDRVVGTSWQDAQPGDAIYFNTDPGRARCDPANWNGCMDNDASHVGVYLGPDATTGRPMMIHAAAPGVGTVFEPLDGYPYPILGVVRLT